MHKPESTLENETHKILWHFETQTDYLTPTKRQDLVLINKKRTWRIVDFTDLFDHRVLITERKTINKYLDLARK